jgi:hypothetical protein
MDAADEVRAWPGWARPSQLIHVFGELLRERRNISLSLWARQVVRWTGAVCLLGVAFLVQELGRVLLENSAGEAFVTANAGSGGWLDMSGAAFVAVWLYLAAHIWILVFLFKWRHQSTGRAEWALPLRAWVIRPWIL